MGGAPIKGYTTNLVQGSCVHAWVSRSRDIITKPGSLGNGTNAMATRPSSMCIYIYMYIYIYLYIYICMCVLSPGTPFNPYINIAQHFAQSV